MKLISIGSIFLRPGFRCLGRQCKMLSTGRAMMQKWDLKFESVPFNGVRVDLAKTPTDITARELSLKLKDSIKLCKSDMKRAMWMKVPVDKSHLIPVAFRNGFVYHHAEGQHAMLLNWLPENAECKVPPYASHHIGVSGVVLNEDTSEVLVVQDRHKYKMGSLKRAIWKFPGGLSDEGEDIGCTAEREVFEETGVKSEFQSILLFRQQHQMKFTFDKSDIFVVCRMKPRTHNIILCDDEIAACQWMPIEELLVHPDTTPLIKLAAKMVLYGMKYGHEHFDMSATKMRSWVNPKQTFKLYHKPLTVVESLRIEALERDLTSSVS